MTNKKYCDIIFKYEMCALSSADRVPGYEPVGQRFESSRARHKKALAKASAFLHPIRRVAYHHSLMCIFVNDDGGDDDNIRNLHLL